MLYVYVEKSETAVLEKHAHMFFSHRYVEKVVVVAVVPQRETQRLQVYQETCHI